MPERCRQRRPVVPRAALSTDPRRTEREPVGRARVAKVTERENGPPPAQGRARGRHRLSSPRGHRRGGERAREEAPGAGAPLAPGPAPDKWGAAAAALRSLDGAGGGAERSRARLGAAPAAPAAGQDAGRAARGAAAAGPGAADGAGRSGAPAARRDPRAHQDLPPRQPLGCG